MIILLLFLHLDGLKILRVIQGISGKTFFSVISQKLSVGKGIIEYSHILAKIENY